MKVGVAYVDIRPDLSKFGQQLRTSISTDVSRAGQDAARSLRTSISGALTGIAAGFGAAKIGGWLSDAVDAASNLNEEASKSSAVFKTASDDIASWAKDAAENLGLSERAALGAASSFGNMFVQMGFSIPQAADMSKRIVQLGVDFRSFSNADITEVIQAQQAAFRGEYDSLQRFLPLMSAATIQQRAMQLTGKKNADQLTAQEKAAATYRLMLEGAGDAAGDFIRTHDSLANQLQRTQAATENQSATIGQQMIPLMKQWNQILRDNIIPAFVDLFSTEGSATSWAAKIQDAVGDMVGFLAGAIQEVARLMANAATKVPFGLGDQAARDLRASADDLDGFRDRMHASKSELQAWAMAGRNAGAAAQLLAGPTKEVTKALQDSVVPTKAAADVVNNLVKARRDLLGTQRDVADAQRGLTKAQADRDKAAAVFDVLGTDTAREELANADEDVADAKDRLADAQDRELDVKDRIAELEAKTVSATSSFLKAFDSRTDAVKALNTQLGITEAYLKSISGDVGNILNQTTGQVLPMGQAPSPVGTAVPNVVAPSSNLGISVPNIPTSTTTNNITVNVTEPVQDPGLIGKAIAWVI